MEDKTTIFQRLQVEHRVGREYLKQLDSQFGKLHAYSEHLERDVPNDQMKKELYQLHHALVYFRDWARGHIKNDEEAILSHKTSDLTEAIMRQHREALQELDVLLVTVDRTTSEGLKNNALRHRFREVRKTFLKLQEQILNHISSEDHILTLLSVEIT